MSERDLIERLRQELGGIETPMMNGDNLALALCSHFDNPDQPTDDEHGWSEDALRGQDEVLDAVHAHYATTIARLSEALAEAEKKGAEVRSLEWEHHPQAAGQVRAPSPFGTYRIVFFGDFALWGNLSSDRSLKYREESLESAKVAAQADFAERVQACLAPPRDLSQGGQHG